MLEMSQEQQQPPSHRLTTSDDLEVSAYLEIAREKIGQGPQPEFAPRLQQESVVVVDFGSQYSRLIARRVRESNVYCEIVPHDAARGSVASLNPRGIILSGGPASVYDEDAPLAPAWVYDSQVPVLGICYGMQVMVHQLGGKVAPSAAREYGHANLHQNAAGEPLFHDLPPLNASVDEPRRLYPGGPSRIFVLGVYGQLAHSGRRKRKPYAGHPVPSRGGSHSAGPGAAGELPVPDMRMQGIVDVGELHRGRHRQYQEAGGRGQGHLRPVGRRRLGGGGHPGSPGSRGPVDVHLREQRPDAQRGARAGTQHLPKVPQDEPRLQRRLGPVPEGA